MTAEFDGYRCRRCGEIGSLLVGSEREFCEECRRVVEHRRAVRRL